MKKTSNVLYTTRKEIQSKMFIPIIEDLNQMDINLREHEDTETSEIYFNEEFMEIKLNNEVLLITQRFHTMNKYNNQIFELYFEMNDSGGTFSDINDYVSESDECSMVAFNIYCFWENEEFCKEFYKYIMNEFRNSDES